MSGFRVDGIWVVLFLISGGSGEVSVRIVLPV